jgi:hypothetical protein
MGSSRAVYDMEHDRFPFAFTHSYVDQVAQISPVHLGALVELSMLGRPKNNLQYFAHVDEENFKQNDVAVRFRP